MDYEDIYKHTKDMQVLYVEDDKASQTEMAEIFEYFFYRVDISVDGVDGVSKYKNYFEANDKHYDIVITDINMPKMNGIELSKAVFEKNPTQELVIISAHDESEYLIQLINMGVNNFLLKPIDYDKILEVLYRIVNKKKEMKQLYKDSSKGDISIIDLDNNHRWNIKSQQLTKNGTSISLTKMEITLMKLLIKNGSNISTNDEILDEVWGAERDFTTNNNLNPLLSRLRKKLPKDMIKTQYGLGYRLSIY